MEKKAIIFDLDGTMWDSTEVVMPLWNKVLAESGKVSRQVDKKTVDGMMGKTMAETMQLLFPELPPEDRQELGKAVCDIEVEYLWDHGARLYDGLEETLRRLKENYGLYVVSNCQVGYIESFMHAHGLEDVFSDIEMPGRTGKSKGENIKLLMERNGITKALYVGDTAGDQTAAAAAGIPFVFAGYGFGHVTGADAVITAPAELPEAAKRILG